MVSDLVYIRTVLQTAFDMAKLCDSTVDSARRYYFLRACENALYRIEKLIEKEDR